MAGGSGAASRSSGPEGQGPPDSAGDAHDGPVGAVGPAFGPDEKETGRAAVRRDPLG